MLGGQGNDFPGLLGSGPSCLLLMFQSIRRYSSSYGNRDRCKRDPYEASISFPIHVPSKGIVNIICIFRGARVWSSRAGFTFSVLKLGKAFTLPGLNPASNKRQHILDHEGMRSFRHSTHFHTFSLF